MNKPARRRSSYKPNEDLQAQQTQPQHSQADANVPSSATNSDIKNKDNGNAMDGAHRKIELQSPEDLTFLINNVRRAAGEHINAAFPPVDDAHDDGADELRVRIDKLVADYISQTFTLAAPNLSINGFDLDARTFPAVYLDSPSPSSTHNLRKRRGGADNNSQPEEIVQYEAFDARKRARVEELAREEEDLMREIAALKRRVPAATAKGFAEGFWEGVRADEEALGRARDGAVAAAVGGGGGGRDDEGQEEKGGEEEGQGGEEEEEGADARKSNNKPKALLDGIGPLERQPRVEADHAAVVDTLGRLRREMPATVAKMERARVAGEYVVTER
ncbi:hypothetical protein KVR01_007887 [Diaporthe batatas]|uniref:uncharacterized protein n=1 Tax=Diaporthe batatas TaxID=748121 RepID=UPI001D050879|nr:uncharacterized protein KVR01_007887 [Diaporthe batatas]KAG8162122.1 hypothetical protein KVR01_007887 [Diaporthe batatas]